MVAWTTLTACRFPPAGAPTDDDSVRYFGLLPRGYRYFGIIDSDLVLIELEELQDVPHCEQALIFGTRTDAVHLDAADRPEFRGGYDCPEAAVPFALAEFSRTPLDSAAGTEAWPGLPAKD